MTSPFSCATMAPSVELSEFVVELDDVLRQLGKLDRDRALVKSAAISDGVKVGLLKQLDLKSKELEKALLAVVKPGA